jgi:hypothetical protein
MALPLLPRRPLPGEAGAFHVTVTLLGVEGQEDTAMI